MAVWEFDGTPNGDGHRIITVSDGGAAIIQASAADGYKQWVDWVRTGNAEWPEAFLLTVGGNDLGGGQSIDGYFFLNNAEGWRIRPAEYDHELFVDGNLFSGDPTAGLVVPTVGGFTVGFARLLSSRAIVDSSGGGGVVNVDEIEQRIVPHVWAAARWVVKKLGRW